MERKRRCAWRSSEFYWILSCSKRPWLHYHWQGQTVVDTVNNKPDHSFALWDTISDVWQAMSYFSSLYLFSYWWVNVEVRRNFEQALGFWWTVTIAQPRSRTIESGQRFPRSTYKWTFLLSLQKLVYKSNETVSRISIATGNWSSCVFSYDFCFLDTIMWQFEGLFKLMKFKTECKNAEIQQIDGRRSMAIFVEVRVRERQNTWLKLRESSQRRQHLLRHLKNERNG